MNPLESKTIKTKILVSNTIKTQIYLTDKNVARTNGTNFPAVNSNCLVDRDIMYSIDVLNFLSAPSQSLKYRASPTIVLYKQIA